MNYQNDFGLWVKKFNKMEQLLKEAGWIQYEVKKNHRN